MQVQANYSSPRSLRAFQPAVLKNEDKNIKKNGDDGQPPNPGGDRFSVGNVLYRAAGGALSGILINHFAGGNVGSAAWIGAGVGAVQSGAKGAVVGGIVGAGAGIPVQGALTGGALGAVFGAPGGAIRGAITMSIIAAAGGGPLAAAGVGAALGIVFGK